MPPNINLKQRLAALSLSNSSPTTPYAPVAQPRSPHSTGKRKLLFTSPWGKRSVDRIVSDDQDARDRVQDVMGKVVFQAGVDFETRPMVVLNASGLPDPREVSYDLLLSNILSYLNLYVESDYTVVFFAAGGRHTPGWNWVWKAYRGLNRKYRKNLKRLYVVHSSLFSKALLSFAGAIISPKFFRKLSYMTTLSELACHIPLTQIDIPPSVYQENLKHEKQITLPTPSRSNIFGVPLEELMGYDGEKGGIPRVVKDSIQYLRDTGLEEEGLFRRSPSTIMLKQAQEAYDRGQVISLETFGDPHLAAVLLKKYLRDLPEPIFHERLYPIIRRCPMPTDDPSDMASIFYIRETILTELVPCAYILLNHVLHLMHDISLRAASNFMDAFNLTIVLCPNLVAGANALRDVSMCSTPGKSFSHQAKSNDPTPSEGKTTLGMVIKLCIQRYYEVFDEARDRSEAVPQKKPTLGEEVASSEVSSVSGSLQQNKEVQHEDEEDIDDAMLVMPIGPSRSHGATSTSHNDATSSPPPSSWAITPTPYKPRRRAPASSTPKPDVRSLSGENRKPHSNGTGNGGNAYVSTSRARSLISIEKAGGVGTVGRKGSISIGRGTLGKSSGAGVEAISISAEGFFSPPSSAPPVPPIPPVQRS